MKEEWRDIEGWENYQVSNLGFVKSNNRYPKCGKENMLISRFLKPSKSLKGYLLVTLCKNGKRKGFPVHRLVAEAFIPNPDNLPQVNHKDEDKTNNCVSNLEWCDNDYNCHYGTHYERASKARINHPKRSKPVVQIDKDTNEIIAEFPSISEAERQIGNSHINMCLSGKRKTCGGFKWQYKKGDC